MSATPSPEAAWTEQKIATVVNEAKRIMTEAWRAGKCGASEVANAQDALDAMYRGFDRANVERLRLRADNERLTNERDELRVNFERALQAAQDTSKVAHEAIESYRLNGREVVRLMSEQIVAEGVLKAKVEEIAALRSELAATRERETPP